MKSRISGLGFLVTWMAIITAVWMFCCVVIAIELQKQIDVLRSRMSAMESTK